MQNLCISLPHPLFQKRVSQGKRNFSEYTSLPAKKKTSNTHNRVLFSTPLKHSTCSVEHPIFSDDICIEHARKLKAFKIIPSIVGEVPHEGLAIIDAIQRLGIDCHFRNEIRQILRRQHMIYTASHAGQNDCLQEVALRFRLLRQEGYHVSADIFNNFRDNEGRFKLKPGEDINGVVALLEASHVSIEGEDVLDEAGDFCVKLLTERLPHLDPYEAGIARNALAHPYHKSLARFMAKNLLRKFECENEWIYVFHDLAKIDSNLVQSLYQKEIVQVSKWWQELGLADKLPFARDQPLKWYIWSMTCLPEASMSLQRVELTKLVSLIYIIDDIFDVHGTLDELILFTETVSRWDLSATNQLPGYMRICFKALDGITNEISSKVYKEHGYNPIHSLRKAWASLCNAFLVEAKWFACGKLPRAEEYLKNGIISTGVHVGLVHAFFLIADQDITTETVELIENNRGILSSTATILRLWDDFGNAMDEKQNGKDGSYIYYYMKEHPDSDAKAVEKHIMNKISNAWKSLNKSCLSPNPFSSAFRRASLNIARMVPLMYSYDDNQRLPDLEELIKSLLYEAGPTRELY